MTPGTDSAFWMVSHSLYLVSPLRLTTPIIILLEPLSTERLAPIRDIRVFEFWRVKRGFRRIFSFTAQKCA